MGTRRRISRRIYSWAHEYKAIGTLKGELSNRYVTLILMCFYDRLAFISENMVVIHQKVLKNSITNSVQFTGKVFPTVSHPMCNCIYNFHIIFFILAMCPDTIHLHIETFFKHTLPFSIQTLSTCIHQHTSPLHNVR